MNSSIWRSASRHMNSSFSRSRFGVISRISSARCAVWIGGSNVSIWSLIGSCVAVLLDERADVVALERDGEPGERTGRRVARRERRGVVVDRDRFVVAGHHHHVVVRLAAAPGTARAASRSTGTGRRRARRRGRSRSRRSRVESASVTARIDSRRCTGRSNRIRPWTSRSPRPNAISSGLCRDFAQKEIAPRAPLAWEEARCPTDLLREMGALGLLGMLIPEEWGGIGMSTVGFVAAMEQLGLADQSVAAAWQAHVTIGSLPLLPLRQRRAARALAATAGRGPRARRVRADRARRRLGRARHPHARGAARRRLADQRPQDVHLQRRHRHVVRRDAAGAHRSRPTASAPTFASFVVEKDTPGFTMGPKMRGIGWRGLDTRELFFDDVWVADDHLVGDPAMGLGQFLRTLEVGRISIAALSLSLTQAVLDLALDYAQRARAVRPADLEVPGDPVQARRHRDRARGGALAHLSRRVPARHRAAVPQGSGDGEAEGQPPRGVRRRRRRCRSTAASATCSSRRSPASTATRRCSRSAKAPTRSSTS